MTLTKELVEHLVFQKISERKGRFFDESVWRHKPLYYNFHIQLKLTTLLKDNPNCGIISLYSPEEVIEVYDKLGRKRKMKIPEMNQPIAWYVSTSERLRAIIISLTTQNV